MKTTPSIVAQISQLITSYAIIIDTISRMVCPKELPAYWRRNYRYRIYNRTLLPLRNNKVIQEGKQVLP